MAESFPLARVLPTPRIPRRWVAGRRVRRSDSDDYCSLFAYIISIIARALMSNLYYFLGSFSRRNLFPSATLNALVHILLER